MQALNKWDHFLSLVAKISDTGEEVVKWSLAFFHAGHGTVISRQPAEGIIFTNQSHTNNSYSRHKVVRLNMAPSSLITAPTQKLPHTTQASHSAIRAQG